MRWEDVLRVALLGTERSQLPSLDPSDEIDAMLSALPSDTSGERQLLTAAGLLWQARRAGRGPLQRSGRPPLQPAPPQSRPFLGKRAAHVLTRMLAVDDDMLGDWLLAVAKAGRTVPPRSLPPLLDAGTHAADLQGRIRDVIGERGAWLARFNPEWSWAGPVDVDEVWNHGKRDARAALLRRLRETDPARARDLVRATWKEDGGETRASFLDTFEIGLSMDDEPLLEDALDDKHREVRKAAVTLLARLPDARLAARMAARVVPLLKIDVDVSGRLPAHVRDRETVLVSLPTECDTGMLRDGVEPKVPARLRGMGERAWWLAQMLRCTPPRLLLHAIGRSPDALVAASASSEWAGLLLEMQHDAAAAFGDVEMARALVDAAIRAEGPRLPYADVCAVLPRAELEARALAELKPPLRNGHPALTLLSACRFAWSPTLGHAFARAIRATISAGVHGTEEARALLPRVACWFPQEAIETASLGWPPTTPLPPRVWLNCYDRFLLEIRQRAEAWAVLAEDAAEREAPSPPT